MPPSLLIEMLERLWHCLQRADLNPIVARGLALSYWGNPRSTQDIDLAIVADGDSTLIALFKSIGMRRRFEGTKSLGLFDLSQWVLEVPDSFLEIEVDILRSNSDYYTEVDQHAASGQFIGVRGPIRIMAIEDLIIHKVYAERLIDQADVVTLLQLHHERIDFPRIKKWVRHYQLETTWAECQRRAQ